MKRLVVLCFWLCFWLCFLGIPFTTFATDIYWEGVVLQDTRAYSSRDHSSFTVAELRKGETLRVYGKKEDRYFVQFTKNMENHEGWVDLKDVAIGQKVVPKRIETKPALEREESPDPSPRPYHHTQTQGVRFFGAPVFNLYNYGTNQGRIGAAYEIDLSPKLTLGMPFSYSFGGGFSTVQFGPDVSYRHGRIFSCAAVLRSGIYFERFYGNGKGFNAGTVGMGWGLRYESIPNFFAAFEPVSVEITPYATQGVPWSIRGQVSFTIGGRW